MMNSQLKEQIDNMRREKRVYDRAFAEQEKELANFKAEVCKKSTQEILIHITKQEKHTYIHTYMLTYMHTYTDRQTDRHTYILKFFLHILRLRRIKLLWKRAIVLEIKLLFRFLPLQNTFCGLTCIIEDFQ